MKINSSVKLLLLMMAGLLVLTACDSKTITEPKPIVTAVSQKTETSYVETPTATPTEVLPSVLNVCIANEPPSLYRYDGRESLAKQSIYAALYGPSDNASLLSVVPSPETPHLFMLDTVLIEEGMTVLDSSNIVRVLKPATFVYTVEEGDSVVQWQRNDSYHMARSTIIYKLNEGQLWSDGEPLTAHDVLYSYHLARRLGLPGERWAFDRTANLEAIDEYTIRWTGIPGFIATDAEPFFWKPLPAHIFETLDDEDLLIHPMSAHTPPGWGPWRITDRQKDKHISFEKNPYYINQSDETVGFDFLNFLIVPNLEKALGMLERGDCQILDKSYQLENLDETRLNELAQKYQIVFENFDLIEQLVFGVRTMDFDNANGNNPITASRVDYFSSAELRQAIAACLSEPNITATLLNKAWIVSNLPPGVDIENLMLEPKLTDPKEALTEAGWILHEGSDGTRISKGVWNVADDTPFSVTLLSGESAQSTAIAGEVVRQLAECGIEVRHQSMPVSQLYAPGPEGPLFGGNFDMAIVNWGELPYPVCELYTSGQKPMSSNGWIGTNISGYVSDAFDYNCMSRNINGLMAEHVPAVLLMPQLRVWLASNEIVLPENPKFEVLEQISPTQP